MALTTFVAGTGIQSAPVNDNFALALNDSIITKIDQLIDRDVTRSNDKVSPFVEAYIDADGRKNSVVTGDTDATFDTDKYTTTASAESTISHAIPSGTFSSTVSTGVAAVKIADWEDGASLQWKATSLNNISNGYVIIEATSITSNSDFELYGCKLLNIASGKWVLFSPASATEDEARQNIYEVLFRGSNGTDPRVTPTYITGLTALKTSVSIDVGKRAFYAKAGTRGSTPDGTYKGTFADTSTNIDCSIIYRVYDDGGFASRLEYPDATVIASSSGTLETGIVTKSNQANFEFSGISSSDRPEAVVLCVGGISFANSGYSGSTNTDFSTTYSVPDFTATTEGLATEDTGWLDFNIDGDTAYAKISEFTAFTSEPTTFFVKLVPKVSGPTAGVPAINGAGVKLL